MFEKYKKLITDGFILPKVSIQSCRFQWHEAIADFRTLKPSPELIADLLTLAEQACEFTYDFGDMTEQCYNSA